MKTSAVILAAGLGTRMRSVAPKVLHALAGRAMIHYSVEAAREAAGSPPIVVTGHGTEAVQEAVGEGVRFVIQDPVLGTGHAVQQAEPLLHGRTDLVLVVHADMPLLTGETYRKLIEAQKAHPGPLTLLTVINDESRGFGRIARDQAGQVMAIVEEAQASPEQLNIREFNVGAYCIREAWLWDALAKIQISPKGEYYLTDLIEIAVAAGESVQTVFLDDPGEAIGINSRVHLAEAEAFVRARINRRWMVAGVTMIDPQTTYIDAQVTIGADTVIWPNTVLQGETHIGQNCVIGPNTTIRDTQLGNDCLVRASVLEGATLEDEVDIGPFAHLRKGAHLARGAHMGNFGEVKNAYLGPGTKMGHFSYIGDATLGPNVNIGAGTVTCNYDGRRKHHTEIGEDVFIGSATMLVAPLKLGDGSRTGAGAVVTKDVPPNTLAVGVPARAIRKLKHGD